MPRSGGRSGRSGGGFGGRSYGGRSYSRSSSAGRTPGYNAYRSGAYATSPPRSSPYQSRPLTQTGGGLGSAVATGMAFGGGSALAHHAVGSLLGRGPYASGQELVRTQEVSSVTPSESGNMTQNSQNTQMQTNPCLSLNTKFVECLSISKDDISKCQTIFNDLISCEKNYYT
jgi:hypothetical protein